MKNINVKTLMVVALLSTSILAMPIMGQADDGGGSADGGFDPRSFGNAFGSFGPGGEMLMQIFEVLFTQALSLADQKELDGSTALGGVYVLHANNTSNYSGTYNFTDPDRHDDEETHFLPFIENGTGGNKYNMTGIDGAYCKVNKAGSFNYSITVGASLTLIIWDDDGSFIEAATKIIDFAIALTDAASDEIRGDLLLTEGVELATWLIVHINDIFTGDELFVFNPITWQKFTMDPNLGFDIDKVWYDFGPNGYMENGDGDDEIINVAAMGWNITANTTKDSYMQWLLTTWDAPLAQEIWTHFSFDLIQLWIKNFEIHIDFSGLSDMASGGTPNIADVFGGLDIEFYLFTHHLEGAYLYNDIDDSGDISVNYTEAEYENGTAIVVDGQQAYRPDTNEITHRLMLGQFDEPVPNPLTTDAAAGTISWGLKIPNAELIPVPVGIDLNSYMAAEREDLAFIEFNLLFNRTLGEPDVNGSREATGQVKLEHNFAPWNLGSGPKNNITGLDLAIVYISSIFHFHLNIENKNEEASELIQVEDDMETEWDTTDNKSIKIGNYLNGEADLEFIDIAGQDYIQGATEETGTTYGATSQIVPVGLWSFSGDAHSVHTGDVNTTTDDFSSDISLDISYNVMYYAVCYPEFNGTGAGIWHDPTFNIYMVFTPNSAGFWALILLIAAVGLAGVATIMIKKKKDREGF